MTPAGVLFLFIGMSVVLFFSLRRDLGSMLMPTLLFLYHIGFTLAYWKYSLDNPSDAAFYYSSAITYVLPFGVGTGFIEWLVQQIQRPVAASYLDMCFFFQIFGFVGICILYKTVMEVLPAGQSRRVKALVTALFFLPGLHFWTCAIGKDSLIFLGICMLTRGLVMPRARTFAVISGLALIFLVRPHIAALSMVAVGLAILWGKDVPRLWKLGGLFLSIIILTAALPFIMRSVGLTAMNPQSLDEYFGRRQGLNLHGGSSIDIRSYVFPLKLFSYLYRPLFFDATGVMALEVSFENLLLLGSSVLLLSRYYLLLFRQNANSLFIRFNTFFLIVTASTLAQSTANLGLAIRQKTMVLPALIILTVSSYAIRRSEFDDGARTSGSGVPL